MYNAYFGASQGQVVGGRRENAYDAANGRRIAAPLLSVRNWHILAHAEIWATQPRAAPCSVFLVALRRAFAILARSPSVGESPSQVFAHRRNSEEGISLLYVNSFAQYILPYESIREADNQRPGADVRRPRAKKDECFGYHKELRSSSSAEYGFLYTTQRRGAHYKIHRRRFDTIRIRRFSAVSRPA